MMSRLNLKLQMHRAQLKWFLDLFLDERATFQLAVSAGLLLDIDRLYSLSKRELMENLTDAFFIQDNVKEVVIRFFTDQAQAAIERVGYMKVEEIESFFNTSEILFEADEFAEVVWALLTDQRTAVAQHGYNLLNATYESAGVLEADRDENVHANQISAETVKKLHAAYASDVARAKAEFDNRSRDLEQLQRKCTDLKGQRAALEKKQQRLEQHVAFLLEENEVLKRRAEDYHTDQKCLKELEHENSLLREKETQYVETVASLQQVLAENQQLVAEQEAGAARLKEYEQIKIAKETFAAELTLVEEAVYKGNQGLEELQTNLDTHLSALQKFHESARGALTQMRETMAHLDTPQPGAPDGQQTKVAQQPRVGVFVDVQNMFYAAKDRFARRVDYIKLLDLIVGPRQLLAAYAYVVQIPEINQSSFLSLLEHNGYTIKSKDLRLRGDGSAKGDWDVGIAVDVVSMLGTLDVVILASGDGDFCPLAELIKQQDKRVEVVAFEHNTSMDLQQIADQFFPIGNELLI